MPENPNPPVALEYDEDRDRWSILVDDGHARIAAVLPESIVDRLAERVANQRLQARVTGLQAQVTAVEFTNLGDSAAYMRKPLTYDPTETVQDLLVRAHNLGSTWSRHDDHDRVELQVIPGTIPKPDPGTLTGF